MADIAAYVSFLADDAIVLYPGLGALDREELALTMEVFQRYGVSNTEILQTQTTHMDGDLAYNWFTANATVDRGDAPTRPWSLRSIWQRISGRGSAWIRTRKEIRTYLLIWHRHATAGWKLKVAMRHEVPADDYSDDFFLVSPNVDSDEPLAEQSGPAQ
jgi:ketosteroid isomerase-like protein